MSRLSLTHHFCIEILSPEDTLLRTRERVHDFLDMGVGEVWVVNPAARSVMIFAGFGMVEHIYP